MSEFKDSVERDLAEVFHDTDFFATPMTVRYDGETYKIPVVLDTAEQNERKTVADDYSQGIFTADAVLYINYADMNLMPRKNHRITVEGEEFNILEAAMEDGEIVLTLRAMEE